MTHIGHWIEHDYISEFAAFFGAAQYRGSDRAYWIDYPTVTKFSVAVSQLLRQGVTAFARADNVGNNLRFEQINVYAPTPRSVLVGVSVTH
jgi:hypothetical protein